MDTNMLVADNIHKAYGSSKNGMMPVLAGVALSAAPGQFIAVTGASGSGKSTLLMILGGLVRPDAGTVFFGGRDLLQMSRGEKRQFLADRAGFVFQQFHLIPYLGGRDNILLKLSSAASRAEALGQLDRDAALLGVAHCMDRKPSEMSVGEIQRVALLRALVSGPSVLFADEPTSNLDGGHTRQVASFLKERSRSGLTVIAATHDPELVSVADGVIALSKC